jgi:RNA polymerase sigma factor (sigma-70 family)
MNRELSERVQRVLDEMNPNYKLALLLHEHQGLSIREIAAITGRTESAVKSQLSRAREQFRGLYDLDRALEAA